MAIMLLKWRHNCFFEIRFRQNQLEKPQFGQITRLAIFENMYLSNAF